MKQIVTARWKGALKGFCAAILAGGLLGAVPASADPIKIESENVVFYGDVDPVLAQDRVRKWEIYRRMVYALSGIANPEPDEVKLTIYGFKDTLELQEFTANPRIGGVYTQGIEGPIFLTSINNKYNEDGYSEDVGFHEYTHHILNSFVKQGFPRWYDEGFANYLSTMEITDDTIVVGDPTNAHVRSFVEYRLGWLPRETVLGAKVFYPNYTRREARKGGGTVFYAQSSIYVNYLLSEPKYRSKLSEYLDLLERPGIAPLEAFEQAYGVEVEDFHREASKYFRRDKFAITTYQPGAAIMDVDYEMSRVSEAALKTAQIPARLAFLSDRTEGDFLKDVRATLEKSADDPLVVMGLVTLDLRNERYDDAVARGEALLAAGPTEKERLRVAALARLSKAYGEHLDTLEDDEYKPIAMTDDIQLALDRYQLMLKENHKNWNAITQLVSFYGDLEGELPDVALEAAKTYDRYYMDGFDPFYGMDLATIYAKNGYTLFACDYFQKSIDDTGQFTDRQLGVYKARLDWFEENLGADCPFLKE